MRRPVHSVTVAIEERLEAGAGLGPGDTMAQRPLRGQLLQAAEETAFVRAGRSESSHRHTPRSSAGRKATVPELADRVSGENPPPGSKLALFFAVFTW